jgi:hypothetical protein
LPWQLAPGRSIPSRGTQVFYTTAQNVGADPLARHDDVGATGDLAVELAMFKSDSNTVPACGRRLWISDDGTRLILDCGRVYRLSRTPAQDLVYAGGLDTVPVVTDAAYAGASDRLYVLASPDFAPSRPVVLTVDVSGL